MLIILLILRMCPTRVNSPSGGCPIDAMITDCYSMYLSSSGMLEPMDGHKRMSKRLHARQLLIPTFDDEENPYHHSLGVDSPHEYFKSLLVDIDTNNKDSESKSDATTSEEKSFNPDLDNYKAMSSSTKNGAASACKSKAGAAKTGNEEPPADRQRMEFLSWPPAPAGDTWDYQWKSYIDERTNTTSKWWHM
jgi:hypothetical protein